MLKTWFLFLLMSIATVVMLPTASVAQAGPGYGTTNRFNIDLSAATPTVAVRNTAGTYFFGVKGNVDPFYDTEGNFKPKFGITVDGTDVDFTSILTTPTPAQQLSMNYGYDSPFYNGALVRFRPDGTLSGRLSFFSKDLQNNGRISILIQPDLTLPVPGPAAVPELSGFQVLFGMMAFLTTIVCFRKRSRSCIS